jgi:putative addiction module CopG family antidote
MFVTLPPDIEAFVEQSVASGEYGSREQVIVAAVELLRERDAELAKLRADIDAGWDGRGIPAEEAFAQLRARFGLQKGGDAA